jgi:hypothetical protein
VLGLGTTLSIAGGTTAGWERMPPLFAAATVMFLHALTTWSPFGHLLAREVIEVFLQASLI